MSLVFPSIPQEFQREKIVKITTNSSILRHFDEFFLLMIKTVTNLGFQFAKNLQTCSCKWWPVQMRACKHDSSNSASILSWTIKAVFKGCSLSDQQICHQLTQKTTTDFFRFTTIYTNCSEIQNTPFATFSWSKKETMLLNNQSLKS